MDKFAKWGALFAIVSSVLVLAFQEFTPKYVEWKKNYQELEDFEEEDNGNLVDPLSNNSNDLPIV